MTGTKEPAIEFEGVGYRYGGGAEALRDVSLSVDEGELLAVVGPNGGGKTTFVKLILGLLGPTSGRVRVLGREPRLARRAGMIGYVPQRSEANRRFPISGRQMVALGAPGADTVAVLDLVGLADHGSRPVGDLSGGQFQRALIARALAMEPKLLLLDEPSVGIDAKGQAEFASLLERIREERSVTIVLVSHDLRTIATGGSSCDRVACLRRGLHFHDAPGGLTPGILGEVFRHDLEWVFGEVHVDAHPAGSCGEGRGGRGSRSGGAT